jgi:hypothetical protein
VEAMVIQDWWWFKPTLVYDYPIFHFINDNAEWLQMDKAGHIYSSYHLGRLGLKCSNGGASQKSN